MVPAGGAYNVLQNPALSWTEGRTGKRGNGGKEGKGGEGIEGGRGGWKMDRGGLRRRVEGKMRGGEEMKATEREALRSTTASMRC